MKTFVMLWKTLQQQSLKIGLLILTLVQKIFFLKMANHNYQIHIFNVVVAIN
jgi:hypothetical protein